MKIQARSLLSSRRKLAARFGVAPDGLPWIIEVDRGAPPESLIIPVARMMGITTPPESWQGELRALSDRVRSMLDARQFVDLGAQGLTGPHYVTYSSLRRLTGPTVLESLLSNTSPRDVFRGRARGLSAEDFEDTRSLMDSREFVAALESEAKTATDLDNRPRACLALDLNGDEHAVVHTDLRAATHARFVRNYRFESLYERRTSRFCVRSTAGSVVEGSLSSEYVDTRRQINDLSSQWLVTIERAELLRECAVLARQLQQALHDKNYLHGDIKPSNVILSSSGLSYIDSLDVEVGEIAPGLSHDYAAPEQILGRPLDGAADQYAFGVLLNAVSGGLLHGEESRFRVPVASQRIEVFHLMKSPSVFISPLHFRSNNDGMKALRMLIEQCLSFEPEGRFESMNELADALDEILDKYSYEGHLETELYYGRLGWDEELGHYWAVNDIYPR